MGSFIKPQSSAETGRRAGAQARAGQEPHFVHEALATPVEGVMNVDHSLTQKPVRTKLVARVRALIQAGFYDQDHAIDALVERLEEEL